MIGLVIIPAFNEEKIIQKVISNIPKKIASHRLDTIVIDDGSEDNTTKIVKKGKVAIISHPINRGLGAALGTGFEYAKIKGYDFLVTIDADGQHDPKEIQKIIRPIIENTSDFVVGSRVKKKGMPMTRLVLSKIASIVTYMLSGIWTTDSQSGFRAFSKKAVDQIVIDVDRMEVSSDFFRQAKECKLKYSEVLIKPIYTDYSLSKGQKVSNSVNIVTKLVLKRLLT